MEVHLKVCMKTSMKDCITFGMFGFYRYNSTRLRGFVDKKDVNSFVYKWLSIFLTCIIKRYIHSWLLCVYVYVWAISHSKVKMHLYGCFLATLWYYALMFFDFVDVCVVCDIGVQLKMIK